MANFCGDCGEQVDANKKFCSNCGGALGADLPDKPVDEASTTGNRNLRTDPRYKCPKCGGRAFYMGWKPASVQTGILDTDTQAPFCGSCDVQMTWTKEGINENRKLALGVVIFAAVGSLVMYFVLQQVLVLP